MKVRYRVVPKQNKKSSFYVNCHTQHVTIQAADSAFCLVYETDCLHGTRKRIFLLMIFQPILIQLAVLLGKWIRKQVKVQIPIIMVVAVVLVNGFKRLKHNVKLKRLKNKYLKASLLQVMINKMNMMMLTKMISPHSQRLLNQAILIIAQLLYLVRIKRLRHLVVMILLLQ